MFIDARSCLHTSPPVTEVTQVTPQKHLFTRTPSDNGRFFWSRVTWLTGSTYWHPLQYYLQYYPETLEGALTPTICPPNNRPPFGF